MSSSIRKENCNYCFGGVDARPRKSCTSSRSSGSCGIKKDNDDERDIDMMCLNNALHELGMLSAITESHKQFLQENAAAAAKKVTRPSTPKNLCDDPSPPGINSQGFCVLRMNSDYVTDFSGVWKCGSLGKSAMAQSSIELSNDSRSKYNVLSMIRKDDSGCCYGRAKSKLNRFRLHVQKPYHGPWMQRWESHEWFPHTMAQNESLILPKDTSTNRSNPGSPEKGPLECSSSSLARSRSLDDIENLPGSGSNSEASPIATQQRSEIETMSQKLERLHVI